METYCVKEKKKTKCIEPSGFKTAQNGRPMAWCTCASCGIKKYRFIKGPTSARPSARPSAAAPRSKPSKPRKPKTTRKSKN